MKRPRIEINSIANKQKRSEVLSKLKTVKKAEKRKRRDDRKLLREQLGDAAPAKAVPHTIDNTRELDETVVLPGDEEVVGDEVSPSGRRGRAERGRQQGQRHLPERGEAPARGAGLALAGAASPASGSPAHLHTDYPSAPARHLHCACRPFDRPLTLMAGR